MRMGNGVEWAIHVLLLLAWVDDDRPVSGARLAAGHDLPPAYLYKQLQALVREGILHSEPGASGGFRLARQPADISLMDVVAAVEGREEAFRCTEIRRKGVGSGCPESFFEHQCAVSTAMGRADIAWRHALSEQSIADVMAEADGHAPNLGVVVRGKYARD